LVILSNGLDAPGIRYQILLVANVQVQLYSFHIVFSALIITPQMHVTLRLSALNGIFYSLAHHVSYATTLSA